MADETKCPQCGTALPKGALAGLCPACLLKLGAAADTVTEGRPAFTPPPIPELAPLFPQLEILELIGRGGMGAVYKARQKELDRIVALKILPPGIGRDPAFAERFTREARALARLNHPGIVTLYEFGRADGLFFFLMEFVDGVNLRQLLQAGRVEPREALAIVPQICDALQYAHDLGIVHRDIKPENILLDRRGRVKVADFGLAKLMGQVAPEGGEVAASPGETEPGGSGHSQAGTPALRDITDAGKLMGTPQYMSPEQVTAPGEVDHRADIYALGVVFYQMLTGELPGKNIAPPSSKVHIDVRLDEVVLRALEKNPALRYQQASVLKTQVETIAVGNEPPPLAGLKPEVEARFSRTAIAGACCGGLGVLALLSVLLFWLIVPTHYGPGSLDTRLSLLLLVAAIPLGVIPLLASTILGWIAVSQIRRSAGKLYGLGLAVSCGLLLPLLAVDAVCIGAAAVLVHMLPLLFIPLLFLLDWLIFRAVWRAVKKGHPSAAASINARLAEPEPKRSGIVPIGRKLRLWFAGASVAIGLIVALQWLNKHEPANVWLPARISDAIGEQYGEAQIRVTSVGQEGQVVLVSFVCDTHDVSHPLLVQYSGPIFDYPPNIASKVTNVAWAVDCLTSPAFMDGGRQNVLAGSGELKGKPAYHIGFVLPDEATATRVVQQLSQVHLGKPRGLEPKQTLLLFSLYRHVGKRADGKPVTESLSGMLLWSREDAATGNIQQIPVQPGQQTQRMSEMKEAAHSAEAISEPPILRFLAWQDQWQTNQPGAARHPDGSAVTNVTEQAWLKAVVPGNIVSSPPRPHRLLLWMSHPALDHSTFSEVTLSDDMGKPIELTDYLGSPAYAAEATGNLGWICWTLGCGEGGGTLDSVTVRVCYTLGPLERVIEVFPANTLMQLQDNGQLSSIGQDAKGRTFVTLTLDPFVPPTRRFDIEAVLKDDRQLPANGGVRNARNQRFEFDSPLADIAKFRIGTRPIRTNEWKNVVLPGHSR